MTSNARSRTLWLRIGGAEDALDRFEAAWHLATGRPKPAPVAVLGFADLPLLAKTLTPARWDLLRSLAASGPSTVYALAKALGRDYKNVHTDAARLAELGLLEKDAEGRVSVPWRAVRAELVLGAAPPRRRGPG